MTGLDYALVIAFLAIIASAGAMVSRLIRSPDDLFVAGRELTPFVLAATITATNLSMYHFVGMGGTASHSGVSIIWMNWTGGIALTLSGLFVLPIMRRLRIRSVPEYLELRYARGLRTLVGAFWGLRLCIYLGILLYIAGTAAVLITGWNHYAGWLLVFSVVSVIYSTAGGAWAVAIMDSVQFLVMLAGGLIMFPIAMRAAGGLPGMIEYFRHIKETVHFVQFVPPAGSHTEYDWLFVLAILLLSIKWACIDQSILQRAFGARNPRVGAKGMVLSGVITTPMAFLWVLPGLAAAKLHPQAFADPDHAIPWLLSTQLPAVAKGLLGFVLCGLVAAQISVITADVNSVATLITSDVFRTLRRVEPSQRDLLRVVRISSICCGLVMLAVAVLLGHSNAGAVKANLTMVGILDMPLFVVTVIYGIAWTRTNWQGAVAGFIGGGLAGVGCYLLIDPQFFNPYLAAPLGHLSSSAAGWLGGIHGRMTHLQPELRNLAPIISSAAALVITPIASFLFAPPTRQEAAASHPDAAPAAEPVVASHSSESVEVDDFHLIPHSAAGRGGMVVVIVAFVVFVCAVIAAGMGWPGASAVAVTAMLAVLLGGVVRVYTR
ncbi:MAG TPA: sodium:solute symporter family protein [Tepidisphaeraceae bacterium]